MPSKDILKKLQPGDVVLFHKKGMNIGSFPIKLANFCKQGFRQRGWTHAALYLGNDEVVEAYPKPGIQRNKLSEAYLKDNYSLLFLRHKNASAEKLQETAKFCLSEQGQPYDNSGLRYFFFINFIPQQFHFILNYGNWIDKLNEDSKYFCSELVARGFEEAGLYCFERKSYKIMPSDFNNSLLFEEVTRVELPKESFFKVFIFYVFYFLSALFVMLIGTVIIMALTFVIVGIAALIVSLIPGMRKKSGEASQAPNA